MPVEGFAVKGPYIERNYGDSEERTSDEVAAELARLHNDIALRGGEVILQQLVPRPVRQGTGVDYVHDWQVLANVPESTS